VSAATLTGPQATTPPPMTFSSPSPRLPTSTAPSMFTAPPPSTETVPIAQKSSAIRISVPANVPFVTVSRATSSSK